MPHGALPPSPDRGAVQSPPAAAAPRERNRVLTGIALTSVSYATFALHDAGIKWLVMSGFTSWQVLFFRSVVILAVCLIAGRGRVIRQTIHSPIRNALFARSLVLICAWLLFYTAARSLQLAELMTIYFASPLLVAALAVPILGEKVSGGRWVTILIGFCGVLVACRPGDLSHEGAIAMALVAAAFWAATMILIRQIAQKESTLVQMLTSCSSFVVLTGIAMFWFWVTPTLPQLALLIGVGLLGAAAQFLLIEGIRRAPATVVSPLEFSALIWSFVLGYLIWSDIPGLNVFAGAGLILMSGALIVRGEWQIARRARIESAAE